MTCDDVVKGNFSSIYRRRRRGETRPPRSGRADKFWTMRRGRWPPALAAKCSPLFQAVELAAFTGLFIPTGQEETAAVMMPAVPNFNLLKTVGTDGVWVKGLLPNDLIRKGSPEHWYCSSLAMGLSRSAYTTFASVSRLDKP
ncbi:hypothetical protein E4U59_001097 [Claviceps monticola]|nr:hypothetical protein E4U59_001097 [Claviceps monticola]